MIVHAIKMRGIFSNTTSALTDDKRVSSYKRLFSDYAFINFQQITTSREDENFVLRVQHCIYIFSSSLIQLFQLNYG